MDLILGSQSPRRRELLARMGLSFRVLTAEIDETKFETEDPEESVRRICAEKAAAVARLAESETCHLSPVTCHLILTADTIVVLDGKILGKPHSEAEARAMLRALSGREHAVYTAFTLLPVGMQSAKCKMQDAATGNRQQAPGDGGREGTGNWERGTEDGSTDCRGGLAGRETRPLRSRNDKFGCASPSDTCHLSLVNCHLSPAASAPFTHCEKTYVKFRALSAEEIDAYVATGEPMDKAGAYGIQGLGAMLVEGIRGDYFTVMGLPVCQLAVALKRFGIDPMLKQEDQQ